VQQFEFEEALRFVRNLGAEAIEVDVTCERTRKFCDYEKLLSDKAKLARWLDVVK
jgi:hypothetical protein